MGSNAEKAVTIGGITRREFVHESALTGAAVAGGLAFVTGCGAAPSPAPAGQSAATVTPLPRPHDLALKINGAARTFKIDPRTTLLDLIRIDAGLTGTKKGCDHGQCGACTVLVNGRAINSCLALALAHANAEITTVEGIAETTEFRAVQDAFVQCDAMQCGYCTSGQVMSACALVAKKEFKSATEIREFMSGNLCRCGAYTNIVAAIQSCLPAKA